MLKKVCLVTFVCAVSLFAAGKDKGLAKEKNLDDVKADSMVYDQPTEWRIFNANGPVIAFAVQRDVLWYATESGVSSIGIKRNDVTNYPKLGSIPSTEVTSMAVDGSGRVWIGGKNGVAYKGEKDKEFTVITAGKGIPDNSVNAIAAGSGEVWVGTDNGAACYQNGSWKTFTTANGMTSGKVQCVAVDSRGNAWCGTDKGISMYDGAKWTAYNMKKGMSWNDTKAIAVDNRKNMVWAAVGEKDVNSFDGKTWSTYMEIQGGLTSIMTDSQSRIWFGSMTGLIKFNGDEWINDPKVLGIPAAQITQMYKDDGGNLWFGMESGVLRFNNPYPF